MSTWPVKPVSAYVGKYKNARRIIIEAVAQRPDLTIPERLALFEQEMGKQMAQFRDERKEEFESKLHTASVSHSCTSKSSGGKKDCGWKDISAPHPDLYTQRKWVETSGTNKGIRVSPSGSSAGLRMTVAGKGKNAGSITVTFRYRPEVIQRRVTDDSAELLNLISDDAGNPRGD